MLGVASWWTSTHIYTLAATGALLMAVVVEARTLKDRRAMRLTQRQEREHAAELAATAAAKTVDGRLDALEGGIDEIREVLVGRPATPLEPDPPPGLVEDVVEHGRILRSLVPNGGTTNSPGDLLLRLAERNDVVLEHPAEEPGDGR